MIEKLIQNASSDPLKQLLEKTAVRVLDWFKKEFDWDGLFVRRSITELLYGYNDTLLTLLKDLLPKEVPTNRFNFSVSDTSCLCVS